MSCLAIKTFFSEISVFALSSLVVWWKAYVFGVIIILFEIVCSLFAYLIDPEICLVLIICALTVFAASFIISLLIQIYVCINHKSNLFSTQDSESLQTMISNNALIKWSGLLLSIIFLSTFGTTIFIIILLIFVA